MLETRLAYHNTGFVWGIKRLSGIDLSHMETKPDKLDQ